MRGMCWGIRENIFKNEEKRKHPQITRITQMRNEERERKRRNENGLLKP